MARSCEIKFQILLPHLMFFVQLPAPKAAGSAWASLLGKIVTSVFPGWDRGSLPGFGAHREEMCPDWMRWQRLREVRKTKSPHKGMVCLLYVYIYWLTRGYYVWKAGLVGRRAGWFWLEVVGHGEWMEFAAGFCCCLGVLQQALSVSWPLSFFCVFLLSSLYS